MNSDSHSTEHQDSEPSLYFHSCAMRYMCHIFTSGFDTQTGFGQWDVVISVHTAQTVFHRTVRLSQSDHSWAHNKKFMFFLLVSFSFFTLFSLTSSLWPFQSGKIILKIFAHVFCITYHHQRWFPAFSAAATQLTRSVFWFSFTPLRGRLVQLEMKLLHFFSPLHQKWMAVQF